MTHEAAKHTTALGVMMVALVACAAGQGQSATQPADALLNVLVFGAHAAAIDASQYTADLRRPIEAYLQRTERFITRLPHDAPPNTDLELVQQAWMRYEKKLAALSDDDRAANLAVEFVQQLKPCYETEGFHDCPEREARFASAYLESHPDGPFSAYLPLLAAHRWLCAAEGYRNENNAEGQSEARHEYDLMRPRARTSPDPMIRAAADRLASRGTCQ